MPVNTNKEYPARLHDQHWPYEIRNKETDGSQSQELMV